MPSAIPKKLDVQKVSAALAAHLGQWLTTSELSKLAQVPPDAVHGLVSALNSKYSLSQKHVSGPGRENYHVYRATAATEAPKPRLPRLYPLAPKDCPRCGADEFYFSIPRYGRYGNCLSCGANFRVQK